MPPIAGGQVMAPAARSRMVDAVGLGRAAAAPEAMHPWPDGRGTHIEIAFVPCFLDSTRLRPCVRTPDFLGLCGGRSGGQTGGARVGGSRGRGLESRRSDHSPSLTLRRDRAL